MTAKPVPEHVSDERLAAIIKGCDGVTLGPWMVRDHCVFTKEPGRCVARLDWHIRDGRDDANAAHIARLDPQTVEALLTELQHRREAEAEAIERCAKVADAYSDIWKRGRNPEDAPEARVGAGREIAEAIRALAASPSSPASGVRVKALEWSTDDYEDDVRAEWFAVCVVGQYLAYQRDGDWRLNLDYASGDEMIQVYIGAFETPDAAKAAAQTEYEARILSALGGHP